MRLLLCPAVVVGLVLAGTTGAVATAHDGAPPALAGAESAATRTATSGLAPAIFPAKPELRIGAWSDRRPGKLHHLVALGVALALLVCALVPLLLRKPTARWRWTSLQPWAQRAPPVFQHLSLS